MIHPAKGVFESRVPPFMNGPLLTLEPVLHLITLCLSAILLRGSLRLNPDSTDIAKRPRDYRTLISFNAEGHRGDPAEKNAEGRCLFTFYHTEHFAFFALKHIG